MSNYPEGFDDRLLDKAPERDSSDIDALCDQAEAKLAGYTIDEVVTTEDDLVRDLAHVMDEAIDKALPVQDGFDLEQDDYRDRLKQSHPKLHALLGAL